MSKDKIHSVAIYPPLGIARVGNSDEFFYASDQPGVTPDSNGGFKDSDGKIKKQVARFRVYGFNEAGEVVKEIEADGKLGGVNISWRVHVANVKAAWYQFNNALDMGQYGVACKRRNKAVKGDNRKQLVIDPGSVKIGGINIKDSEDSKEYHLDQGEFYGKKVKLGELRTDEAGRLLFFGGDGLSGYKDPNNPQPAKTFANNDNYHDDTSDGVIRATVTIGREQFEATPAMVAVTPPNYGPGIDAVVTMNDVVEDMFIREMDYPDTAKDKIDFWEHIYPMFKRMTDHQWVNHGFFVLFGRNSPSDFTTQKMIDQLKDNSAKNKEFRQKTFEWFRDPDSKEYKPEQIPPFYGDGFSEYSSAELALVDLPITRTQYARLKRWADGDFEAADCPPVQQTFDALSPAEQIQALNKAPLEECLGGPFHPGIEITWSLRVKSMWETPYRLKVVKEGDATKLDFGSLLAPGFVEQTDGPVSVSGPGALTRWLGVPWQTDEASCLSGYDPSTYLSLPSFWAARVPNEILSNDSFERMSDDKTKDLTIAQRLKHFDYRQHWLRDFGSVYQDKINYMIHEWHELGIIEKEEREQGKNEEGYLPDEVFVETGRHVKGVDASFEQVKRAEGVKKRLSRSVPAKKAPEKDRPRRTYARDER